MDSKAERRGFFHNAGHSGMQPLREKHESHNQGRSLQEPEEPDMVQQRGHRHLLPEVFRRVRTH